MRVFLLFVFAAAGSDGLVQRSGKERVLVAMADTRSPELTVLAAQAGHDCIGYWTENYIAAAQEALEGSFDFTYFKCSDVAGRPWNATQSFINAHWCKVVVLNHLAEEGNYDRVVMLDTDVSVAKGRGSTLAGLGRLLESQDLWIPSAANKSFHLASLRNVSVITSIPKGCGLGLIEGSGTPNVHCTGVLLARMDAVSKDIMRAWLETFSPRANLFAPYWDQLGFNQLLDRYGPAMAAVASDVFQDAYVKAQSSGCRYVWDLNNRVLRDLMPMLRSSVELLHHSHGEEKRAIAGSCSSADRVRVRAGRNLAAIIDNSASLIQEIDFVTPLQAALRHAAKRKLQAMQASKLV